MPRRISNPPNPWLTEHVEYLGEPPVAELEVHEEHARSIVTENDSPDIEFRYGVNPYRGCFHGCAYCYARTTHQYLGWGAGTDFERKIVVKVNAPELLRLRLRSRSWKGDLLGFSGVTDCYQPLEASYRLTRECLTVCLEHRNPVTLVTKGPLVARDADVLAALATEASACVFVSLPFLDGELARTLEPSVASPEQRLQALATLAEAGIPTGVSIAPLIPGLSEEQIPSILARAREAGARYATLAALRLPAEVAVVFRERLERDLPLRARRVLAALDDIRGGRPDESRFGARMVGCGPRWETIAAVFELEARRQGLLRESPPVARGRFRRPDGQGRLFEA